MSLFDDLVAAGLPVELLPDGSYTFTAPITDVQTQAYYDILRPERIQRRAEVDTALIQFRDEYEAAKARLLQIENATNPTNAQVIQAVRDMAKYERLMAKLLAKLLLG